MCKQKVTASKAGSDDAVQQAKAIIAQLQKMINNNKKRKQNPHEEEGEEEAEEEKEETEEEEEADMEEENNEDAEEQEEEMEEDGEEMEDEEEINEVVAQTKTASHQKTNKPQNGTKTTGKTPTTNTSQQLIEKYSKLAAKKIGFGKSNSWYTLKFNVLKECTAARYYVVIMEFSNDDEGELLNIWLKATYINDVLKGIAEGDPEAVPLFNGFESIITNAATANLRVKPYGENVARGNEKNGYTYKEYVNYYLIPKEMGSYKATVEKFKNMMVKLLQSPQFFSMMTVYQDNRTNRGGQPGKILRDSNAELWNQLRKENNYRLNYINSLNAKFTDDTIIVVLYELFGGDSIQAKYQKFGWDNKDLSPFPSSKNKK